MAAAEHRWDLAEQRARLVLRRFAAGRGPRPARRALLVSVSVVVELALLVTAVVLPPDAPVRWLLATVVASVALIVFIASVIVAVRRRGTPDRQPVIGSLSAREQRAVKRVVRGRGTAPDDRRTVVRAAAVQMAAADGLPGLYAYPILWSALAASGVSTLSVLYPPRPSPRSGVSSAPSVTQRWPDVCSPTNPRPTPAAVEPRRRPTQDRDPGTRSGHGPALGGSIDSGT